MCATPPRPSWSAVGLCGDRIDATSATARGSDIDHALDDHVDYLRVDPDRVFAALTVSPRPQSL